MFVCPFRSCFPTTTTVAVGFCPWAVKRRELQHSTVGEGSSSFSLSPHHLPTSLSSSVLSTSFLYREHRCLRESFLLLLLPLFLVGNKSKEGVRERKE